MYNLGLSDAVTLVSNLLVIGFWDGRKEEMEKLKKNIERAKWRNCYQFELARRLIHHQGLDDAIKMVDEFMKDWKV